MKVARPGIRVQEYRYSIEMDKAKQLSSLMKNIFRPSTFMTAEQIDSEIAKATELTAENQDLRRKLKAYEKTVRV